MFSTILIANRGEIARRIMHTAKRLGLRTIAVYSDADEHARHVRDADEAFRIGPPPVADSYLRMDAILDVASRAGADCVHPGYGFLAENADFAEACAEAGLTFIGPGPDAIRAMGLKDESKRLMEAAGVPVTPGYHGADQDEATLKAAAKDIGYPVLIKAVAGGGGKGMRRVNKAGEFSAALTSARREAKNAFGDHRVLVEKFITGPRHIEVQVFGDAHGNIIHLFERDCSLQRRHQKVIEEAPAPGMTDDVRAAMTEAAITAARAVDYVNAGTVEFIVDGSGPLRPDGFWFMEMNTRLQVEHPVTEKVTGLDLVEMQLRVAAGEALPQQGDIGLNGHAVEARLYAEDPAKGFLPSTGTLSVFDIGGFASTRIDSGVGEGDAVSPHFDPMIAKVIEHGEDRGAAADDLCFALQQTRVFGVASNAAFLARCLEHPAFQDGAFDTGFIDAELPTLANPPAGESDLARVLAAAWRLGLGAPRQKVNPWSDGDGYRVNGPVVLSVVLDDKDGAFQVAFTPIAKTGEYDVCIDGQSHRLQSLARRDGRIDGCLGDASGSFGVEEIGETTVLFRGGAAYPISSPHPEVAAEMLEGGDSVIAPMPGKVIAVSAKKGAAVQRGDTLLVLEAMKMEHALNAPRDGEIEDVLAKIGAQVGEGDVLVRLTATD